MQKSGDDIYLEVREFSRVDADIPMKVRLVPPEERNTIRSRVSGGILAGEFQALADLEDRLLTDWLKMLDAKLNSIIAMLSLHLDEFCSLPLTKVNISGSGLRFSSTERYNSGDILEVKMMFPLIPPITIYVYGEVVTVNDFEDRFAISVKFIAIDEEVRDEITRFVFKKQKEILRERREVI
ncbi:PilZ domain-containing protein [Thermodesulfovibrionales bacterium]|nr:PilZ domain-containing protein [Thermodesulfovibrionales bacterium]